MGRSTGRAAIRRARKGELVPARPATPDARDDLPDSRPSRSRPSIPVLEYDFGQWIPRERHDRHLSRRSRRGSCRTIPTFVPKVNADGNETSGVGSVLHQAPLGRTSAGTSPPPVSSPAGAAGLPGAGVPFARTRAERDATATPRQSVEERYGTLEGTSAPSERREAGGFRQRFLLRADADRLVEEARRSGVLPGNAGSPAEDRAVAAKVCSGG